MEGVQNTSAFRLKECLTLNWHAFMRNGIFLAQIRLYVKFQDPFRMSFKLKLRSLVSVPSLIKKEINAFDSFGIE